MQPANTNLAPAISQAEEAAQKTPFYERGTIQSLVWPVSEEEFFARYWEKKPLIVHRQDPGYYGDLFTLQDFDTWTRGGRGYVKTAEATAKKQSMHQGTGPASMERVLTDMQAGRTLILDGMQEYHPKLGHFCRMLTHNTAVRYQTNLYLTPPNGKGFTPHWDNHDVYVLQVLGSKRWKVEKTRRALPAKDGQIEEAGREMRGELHEFTLNQGDMVYIPRGFVHAAECGSECSLHVTLGLDYNSWDELLQYAVKAAIQQDDSLRLSLPVGYMKGDGAGIVKRLSQVLTNVANPAFLAEVLNQYRDEFVQRTSLDISGQIVSFFEAKEIKLDDRVGPRPALFYTIRENAETVTLKIGTRAITFPDFFGPALQFALENPSYTVGELPGDLEDGERIVFIERLMQEAVVTRVP